MPSAAPRERVPWRRRAGAARAAVLAGVLFSAGMALSACTAGGAPEPSVAAGATPAGSADRTTQASVPLETSQTSAKSPVYWLGRSRDGIYLYREFREAGGEDNPVTTALKLMMTQKPLDPDYFTPWQQPRKLAASISGKNIITVDVSSDAFNSNVDEPTAQLAVQQLVYTATAAAASAGLVDTEQPTSVMLLVDGRTAQLAFERVQLGQLMQRDASMAAPGWIIDPQEDTRLGGQLKVFGRAVPAGTPLAWQVLKRDASGSKSVYLSGGITSGQEPGKGGEFTFVVNLEDGDYELRILPAADAAAPANAGSTAWDTKAFRIGP
ncbi:GerMN domain-containing protein [Sinomonas mesophila]|uniref:GerMN domain-containing protein n=1 Tax=Sinomonas mesophila TaxID=1531955 RepID=UPI0009845C18|nr:GerMN domain-containing protein [Sinomonas mesophila]